jgi:hypothetical protein
MHRDVRHGHENREERGAHHDAREKEGRDGPHEMENNRREHEPTGRDAADARPSFIPDYELLPRDDSGGPGFKSYTMAFGDGVRVTCDKEHLSAHGGGSDEREGDELSEKARSKGDGKKKASD